LGAAWVCRAMAVSPITSLVAPYSLCTVLLVHTYNTLPQLVTITDHNTPLCSDSDLM
jgi:hypothetical protein